MADKKKVKEKVSPPPPPPAKPAWKDISSYGRNDTDRTPRSFEIRTRNLRIAVTRHIHLPADQWGLDCYELAIFLRALQSKDIEDAKKEALLIIKQTLQDLLTEVVLLGDA